MANEPKDDLQTMEALLQRAETAEKELERLRGSAVSRDALLNDIRAVTREETREVFQAMFLYALGHGELSAALRTAELIYTLTGDQEPMREALDAKGEHYMNMAKEILAELDKLSMRKAPR